MLIGLVGLLASYAPRIYEGARTNLKKVFEKHDMELTFQNSIYPAATINFGPRTVCVPHNDGEDDPVNFCHVTALGTFDPTKGGHIVLHDLKLMIEFPPGASILFPSALLRHSNTGIQPGERRQSFTQWVSGPLIRWADTDFRTYAQMEQDDPEERKRFDAKLKTRRQGRINLFSKPSNLTAERASLKMRVEAEVAAARPCEGQGRP